jgi:hypothetical protein
MFPSRATSHQTCSRYDIHVTEKLLIKQQSLTHPNIKEAVVAVIAEGQKFSF